MTADRRKYGNRYQVSRPIGAGGMAEVFLARDELLGRSVALKVLHPEFARDRAFIERFRREAQAAAQLNDPRVVSIFDWGSDNGTYYIVMEFVEGRTLREVLEAEGALSPEAASTTTAEVCDALHLAHMQGIVHRDVKPANIIVASGGQTKVTDFGIARAATTTGQTVTQTGTVIGTAAYLSPEQAQGLSVDARSDVYSAAVVLYELLTGEVPFKGDTPVTIAYKHVTEDPTPPSRLNPRVPPELDAIVMKGLAKNPENRFQSAEEMGADLRRWVRGEPVAATPLLDDRTVVAERTAVVGRPAAGDRTQAIPIAEEPRGRRAVVYTLTVLLFLGIIVAVVALVFSLLTRGAETVEVPSVLGMTFPEAQVALDEIGLRAIHAGEEPSDIYPAGQVSRQDPADGQKVRMDSAVRLTVSSGPPEVEVPEVVGKTEDEARRDIEALDLVMVVASREPSGEVEAGRVISQDPAPGSPVAWGSEVRIVVSGGPPTVRVPDVLRQNEARARERLIGAGLEPRVAYVCNRAEDDDVVLEQDPRPNTEVAEGSQVTITVNDVRRVPGVVGMERDRARSELEDAGFNVTEVEQDTPNPAQKNRVISQDPDQGTVLCPGATVTIVVGK